ncbi:MAG: acyl-CoA dehydrogenase family protein [Pseudolabrys sp.]|nr:acyl-CoA dehydrogenase family protein [Pseudolabrys sp.]
MPDQDLTNQSPPFVDIDLYSRDRALQDAVQANGGTAPASVLSAFGRHTGRAEMFELAHRANDNAPRLDGERVIFDPAYHRFMADSMRAGLHAMTWKADGERAPAPAEVARSARYYMVAQVENGHMCPITMTRAAVAALAAEPALLAEVMPKVSAHVYDPSFEPWTAKQSMTIGMGMTEKQGGTDVRANITCAVHAGDHYRITGHKWFMSAPMCDAFLVLAQAHGDKLGGLTCFFMPRFRPDGSENGLHFVRLKPKLGNRSNASSEVEFKDAYARRIGAEGAGIRTIIEMVQLTRLDCAIASAGIMRMALAQAIHHTRHRIVFQKKLIHQPLMENVLADLALESEAALAAVMRLARAFDQAARDPYEAAFARLLTPAIKYWVCKIAPGFVYEAMECLGGNGYVEDSILPRLYREAPVNAIWEGSGNVMCLDVLRAFVKDATGARQILDHLAETTREFSGSRAMVESLEKVLAAPEEAGARRAVEQLAQLAAASALMNTAPEIAENFMRACEQGSRIYGGIVPNHPARILERALAP